SWCDHKSMAGAVVLGNLAPDEPFPFAWYASLASARKRFGRLPVYADQLPYGYWWDRIRDGVTVVREGEPPPGVERLPAGKIWRPDGTGVREGEPGWDDALALFREDPDQRPAINRNGGGNARRVVDHVARQLADAQARARPLPTATPQIEHRRLCVG